MEKVIRVGESIAFITGVKDDSDHEHVWDGETLITFSDGTQLTETEHINILRDLKNVEDTKWYFRNKGAVRGEVTCSICGVGYTRINNPNYL